MTDPTICPMCERGELGASQIHMEIIKYRGERIGVHGIRSRRCRVCREEVVLPEDYVHNAQLFDRAREAADRARDRADARLSALTLLALVLSCLLLVLGEHEGSATAYRTGVMGVMLALLLLLIDAGRRLWRALRGRR